MGVLSLTATGFAQAAGSIATVQAVSSIALKLRVLSDPWVALTSGQSLALEQIDDGTNANAKIQCLVTNTALGYVASIRLGATGAFISTAAIPAASMPPSGQFVVIYGSWDAVNNIHIVSVYDQTGTNSLIDPAATVRDATALGGLPVITANGRVRINQCGSATQRAMTYDCIGIYSRPQAAGTEDAIPKATDSGILALWKYDDPATANFAVGSVGGQSMGITAGQFSFLPGGAWDPGSGFTLSTGLSSPAQVGTVVAVNSSAGGRLDFAPAGIWATVSSHPAVGALTVMSIAIQYGVDVYNMGGNNNHKHSLFQIDDGTDPNCKIAAFIQENSAGVYQMGFSIPGLGVFRTGTFTQSQAVNPLPAFGAALDVISYFWWDNPNKSHGCALYDTSGNLIAQIVDTTNRVNVPVYTNGGQIRLNYSQDATNDAADPDLNIDGIAIFNRQRAVPYAIPSINEAGIVAFYRLDEQSGTISVDDMGGPSLQPTVGGTAWEPGGSWLSGNTVTVVTPTVLSPSAVASRAASPSDTSGYIVVTNIVSGFPVTGVFSPAVVVSVGQINTTQYAAGVSAAGGVGAVFRGNVSADAFPAGVASLCAVGVVFTNINVPVSGTVLVPGLVSGAVVGNIFFPSVSNVALPPGVQSTGVVGLATLAIFIPPPPIVYQTLQYIVDMATAFSTANQGLAVLTSVPQLVERIRSDQKAIFSKVGARNRTYYLETAPVTSTFAASARTIDLSGLVPPVERVLQVQLSSGEMVNLVDLLDVDGELAPRAYLMGTTLVEVSNDWDPDTTNVDATLAYVGGPADLDPAGDLTQAIAVPPDWSDLLIIPLAQFLAAQDTGPAGQAGTPRSDEVQILQQMYDQRLDAFLTYLDHYAGVPAYRFDIPRPPAVER